MWNALLIGLPAYAADSMDSDELARLSDQITSEIVAMHGGTSFEPFGTEIVTPDQLRAYIAQQLERERAAPNTAHNESILRLVGLVPNHVDLGSEVEALLDQQVAGYYDPELRSLRIVLRSDIKPDSLMFRMTLAHEIQHALDDQRVDLYALVDGASRSEDAAIAARAVAEGSATSIMQPYLFRDVSGPSDALRLIHQLQKETRAMKRGGAFDVDDALPYVVAAVAMPYASGARFLGAGVSREGTIASAFLAAAVSPPLSTEQILHPEKYWSVADYDPPVEVADGEIQAVLDRVGLATIHENTLGELLCSVLVASDRYRFRPSHPGNDAGSGWGGDRFYLVTDRGIEPSAERGLWVTAWDTPTDREEFLRALRRRDEGRTALRLGDRVAVLFYGFDDAMRVAITDGLRQDPLELQHMGRTWTVGVTVIEP